MKSLVIIFFFVLKKIKFFSRLASQIVYVVDVVAIIVILAVIMRFFDISNLYR